ncbi:MAG: outer membrane lipoprotein-sorting protein, partial [Spirochaetota bacterium]
RKVVVELTKKSRNAPYSRIVQHYEGIVLKNAEFYSGQNGDILMKQAQYSRPLEMDGYYFYTQVKILNELQTGSFAVIAFSTPKNISIPEAWFNPNNLGQVP